jgi:hypothetical protein
MVSGILVLSVNQGKIFAQTCLLLCSCKYVFNEKMCLANIRTLISCFQKCKFIVEIFYLFIFVEQ